MGLIFEWDDNKATANAIKHGVAFTEAGTIFGDEQSITIPDFKHSQKEPRFITMGMSQMRVCLLLSIRKEATI
jgi:uncharacterized DUF497 family protein